MKICFVICELNPLHNGHLYLLRRAKETGCDCVVGIMSGNFVQRGEIAIADKYTRAEWAVKAGMDAVFELPVANVLASARYFADGGIKIAQAFDADKTLMFGAENADEQTLASLSDLLAQEPPALSREIKSRLAQGKTYPRALSEAIETVYGKADFGALLTSPNNVLALEYYRGARTLNADLTLTPVQRVGNGYHDLSRGGEYLSASAIRQIYAEEPRADAARAIAPYCPDYVVCDLGFDPAADAKLLAIAKYALRDPDALRAIGGMDEGLERRLCRALQSAQTLTQFYASVKCKRYPMARIKRALISAVIGNDMANERLLTDAPRYLNLLALRKDSRALLSAAALPVTTSRAKKQRAFGADLFDAADDLYRAIAAPYRQTARIVE